MVDVPTGNPELSQALRVLAELHRRYGAASQDSATLEYVQATFGPQRDFVLDSSKRKAALCGRRSGKTEGTGAWLLAGGETAPGEMSVYIALRRSQARNVLWRTLIRIDKRHSLGLQFTEIDKQLVVKMKNDHQIWLAGCDDYAEMDKFRGARYRRVAIDECQSFGGYLRELVEDVIEPALLDLDGELALCGTPSPVPAGYFYQITTGEDSEVPRWPTHHWTCLDNPHLPHAARFLDEKRAANRWTDEHPTYLREWKGLWVRDDSAIVFPYEATKNAFRDLPADFGWKYVLGVDLGWHDKTAFSVLAYRRGFPEVFLVKGWKRGNMIPSAVAAHIEQIRREFPLTSIVVDTGGLGRAIVEDFRRLYAIPAEAAQKTDKAAAIELLRGALKAGTFKLDPFASRELLDEWAVLQWDEDKKGFDERFACDLSDATLYAYRATHADYRPVENAAKPGSRQYQLEEEERMYQECRARVKDRGGQWWGRLSERMLDRARGRS